MSWKTGESAQAITPEELAEAVARGSSPVIVDVRSPQQYRDGHLPGAINIPLGELEHRASELDSTAPTVFY
jgi:rhodanese-related sulfurtransferase